MVDMESKPTGVLYYDDYREATYDENINDGVTAKNI